MVVASMRWPMIAGALVLASVVAEVDMARGQSLLASPRSTAEQVRRQAHALMASPDLLRGSKTLQARTMRDLVQLTAPVARDASRRYLGDFEAYWRASNLRNQRLGKTLEAVIAWRANEGFKANGSQHRVIVTAAEGFPHDPADLVELAPDGTVVRRYQVKLGANAAIKALSDPKYADMSVITTSDSLRKIEQSLLKAESRAAGRGIPLSPQWMPVRESLNSGRLVQTVGGKPLPQFNAVMRYGLAAARRLFNPLETSPLSMSRLSTSGLPAWLPKTLGKGVVVVDVAATGYAEWRDIQRFRRRTIGGKYLAAKTSLRVAQVSLAVYALVTPEPGSKTAAALGSIVLVVVDVASDPVYELVRGRRELAARRLLESIERAERYHAVREHLAH